MEASHASIAMPSNFFCNVGFSNCCSSFPSSFRSNGGERLADYSVLFLKVPSCGLLAARGRLAASATAHSQFRRPNRRRNSLRKKLSAPWQDEVRLFPEQLEWGSDGHGPCADMDAKKESGNSALRDKLESWVGRYREDSEFWGIGAAPIFIISEDSDGKMVRVSVDENEILKRNRIRAWSLEGDEESDISNDVDSKIHRARSIAKEIEAGAYHMPRNSSTAKFIVEGKKFSFVRPTEVISSRLDSVVKIFPRIALLVSCCLCVLSVVRMFYVGYSDVELTREETEMLRRKKKYRMEREESQRSVEVLHNGYGLPVISATMPNLVREELMERIMQAKESRQVLISPDPSGHLTVKDHDLDRKVREIREMVRKVHEVEEKSQSLTQHTGEQNELSSILVDSEVKVRHIGHDKNVDTSSRAAQENSEGICMNANDKNTLGESMHVPTSEISNGEPSSNFGTCKSYDDEDMESQERSTLRNTQKIPVGIDMCNSVNPGVASKGKKQGLEITIVNNRSDVGEETNKNSSVLLSNKRRKPKVITSLKEAKEYLTTKCRIPKYPIETEQEVHLNWHPDVQGNYESDCNIHTIKESMEASNSSLWSSNERKASFVPQLSYRNIISDINSLEQKDKTQNYYMKTEDAIKTNSEANLESTLVSNNAGAEIDLLVGQNACNRKTSEDCIGSGTLIHNNHPTSQQHQNHCANSSSSVILNQDGGTESAKLPHLHDGGTTCNVATNETKLNKGWPTFSPSNALKPSDTSCHSVVIKSAINKGDVECYIEKASDANVLYDAAKAEDAKKTFPSEASIPSNFGTANQQIENSPETTGKRWVEENFQKFDPIIEKIGHGFKDNYLLAKEKVHEDSLSILGITKLGLLGNDDELEWMKDENLREIVYQVRDNELAGRDPFHLMDANDQQAFFQGLERKAEKVNEKLAGLHEWIHSRIENLDYGADGISLDDPLEKIMPRWKGPPIDEDPEFLMRFPNIGSAALEESIRNLHDLSEHKKDVHKSQNLSSSDGVSTNPLLNNRVNLAQNGSSAVPKTIVECSDGSSKPGKKKGNEQWQHTKKWSQGFLEVYNTETDPEVKSMLKDMGKDLDRWITEREIKHAAALMTRIPKKKRKLIKGKMNKIEREVKKYGAQAVVSKYKEYADEKEEDYLWWLDLKFVLCIELYSVEDDVPKVGFYSLEMAEDLDLNPKQYHVIAFEDAGDSKNFCHVVQAKMDAVGSGKAFVVARPPKDAFREAKANGFNVTLIRKGELKLNVDQTLGEVEEELKEIGSKIYHDKIMKERGVDVRSLVKGMIEAEKFCKRS